MMQERGSVSPEERNELMDAEVGMVRVLEEWTKVPYDYLTYIIDPRNFINESEAEGIPVALGIARKGAIARVTTREELDQCVLITPRVTEEGKLGVAVQSSPQMGVPVDLGPCIERLNTGVESLQKAIEMFGRNK